MHSNPEITPCQRSIPLLFIEKILFFKLFYLLGDFNSCNPISLNIFCIPVLILISLFDLSLRVSYCYWDIFLYCVTEIINMTLIVFVSFIPHYCINLQKTPFVKTDSLATDLSELTVTQPLSLATGD